MGKVSKGVNCSVSGCNKVAVRSVSTDKAHAAKLNISSVRRAYICDEHYKELKKRLKKDRAVEKWRWGI